MRSRLNALLAALILSITLASPLLSHCQIPCGIYDDEVRFTLMAEHVTTIEKSMQQIEALSVAPPPNTNQLGRWILNKENHADELTEIVTFYFLAQRIKPADPSDKAAFAKYQKELMYLHQIMIHAMKAKQTVDLEHVQTLRKLIHGFHDSYMGTGHKH